MDLQGSAQCSGARRQRTNTGARRRRRPDPAIGRPCNEVFRWRLACCRGRWRMTDSSPPSPQKFRPRAPVTSSQEAGEPAQTTETAAATGPARANARRAAESERLTQPTHQGHPTQRAQRRNRKDPGWAVGPLIPSASSLLKNCSACQGRDRRCRSARGNAGESVDSARLSRAGMRDRSASGEWMSFQQAASGRGRYAAARWKRTAAGDNRLPRPD